MFLPQVISAPALLVAFGAFGAWTLRRLWHRGSSAYDRFVYRYGVRYFGVTIWILLSLVAPRRELNNSFEQYALGVLINAVICLPLGLWAGYWWGRSMARWFGVGKDQ
jgi:hypothetical protein